MNLACLHTHSTFCDGKDDIDSLCRSAIDQGLTILGFSAHAPLPRGSGLKSNWHLDPDHMDAYVEAVLQAKATYQGNLHILLGLEIDYIPGLCGPQDHRFDSYPLDYRIGSVHYLYDFTVDGPVEEWEQGVYRYFGGDYEAAALAYWERLAAMVTEGGFDILGHMDLVKKNHSAWWHGGTSEAYRAAAFSVLSAIETNPVLIEVNTGGLNRGTVEELYPSRELLTEMCKRGLPLTINADAHSTRHLTGNYDRAVRELKAVGYTHIFNLYKEDALRDDVLRKAMQIDSGPEQQLTIKPVFAQFLHRTGWVAEALD
ncbi:MAG: histidinol-phosphatase [Termitinemataceae bacterium]